MSIKQYNAKLTPLAFFDDINEQIRFKTNAYRSAVLISEYGYMNFQLQLPRTSFPTTIIAEIYDDKDHFVNDISTNIEIKIGRDFVWFCNNRNSDMVAYPLLNPYLYIKIIVNGIAYYSDIFYMPVNSNETDCLNNLDWLNDCDLMNTIYTEFINGYDEYRNSIYFRSKAEKGQPFVEMDEIQNGRKETKIIKASIKDTLTLTDLIPASSVDAFSLINLHSTVAFAQTVAVVRSVTFDDTDDAAIKLVSIVLQTYSDFQGGCCNDISDFVFPSPTAINQTTSVEKLSVNGTTDVLFNILNNCTGSGLRLTSITFIDIGHSATPLNNGYNGTFSYTRPANVITDIVATYTVTDVLSRTASATLTLTISNP